MLDGKVTGLVEKVELADPSTQAMGSPTNSRVRYRYTVDGVEYSGERFVGKDSAVTVMQTKGKVLVHYDIRNPEKSTIINGWDSSALGFDIFLLLVIIYSIHQSPRGLTGYKSAGPPEKHVTLQVSKNWHRSLFSGAMLFSIYIHFVRTIILPNELLLWALFLFVLVAIMWLHGHVKTRLAHGKRVRLIPNTEDGLFLIAFIFIVLGALLFCLFLAQFLTLVSDALSFLAVPKYWLGNGMVACFFVGGLFSSLANAAKRNAS